jgi:hypothetical protein
MSGGEHRRICPPRLQTLLESFLKRSLLVWAPIPAPTGGPDETSREVIEKEAAEEAAEAHRYPAPRAITQQAGGGNGFHPVLNRTAASNFLGGHL